MQYSSSDEAVYMSMSKPDLLEVVATQPQDQLSSSVQFWDLYLFSQSLE